MTQPATGNTFIRDFAGKIISLIERAGFDEKALNEGLIEAAQPVIKHPDLRSLPGPLRPGNHIDWSRYLYWDGDLYVTVDHLAAGLKVRPHDHGTYEGFIIYKGRLKHTHYHRKDDGSVPGFADLKMVDDREMTFGDAITVLPPNDIHSFEVLEDTYCVTWVAGHYKEERAYFDPAAKSYVLRNPQGASAQAKH